ncbi:Hypothetical protein BC94_0559 [Mycoplasmopsis bovis]|uniref:Uncharacterized protein n=1 Tax=Mycoplasmopsis bovis TaxID=28903 RepID=A0A8D4A297_MYCBV|nr:Hypothetical protein BC85_0556 [Mycoplasmopsis bovis]AMW25822.1 Hypothetical protein BC94_0559 [Mycoplasmopsis bovis]AMW26453.1 Hypothetical protein BC93_0556 [Mycoplasmopsis bovis]
MFIHLKLIEQQTSSKLKELLSLYSRLRCYQLTHLKLTNNLKV